MTTIMPRFVPVALVALVISSGCAALNGMSEDTHRPKRWSDEWYAIEAESPAGARQRLRGGKLWPPFSRPTGKDQQFLHKFHTAHYWPYPYQCQDRQFVRTVSQSQVNNGWIAATTLYSYHFDPETHSLNHSGRLQLRWILEDAPPNHRLVWVQAGTNSNTSQSRLSSVRDETADMIGEPPRPPIMLRVTSPLGRPAGEVDQIWRRRLESQPLPRIRYTELPTGTGGD